MKHNKLLLLTLLFLPTFIFAQTITITGYVIDDDTEEGLPFCNVYIKGTSTGVATDIDGNYSFTFDTSEGDSLVSATLGYPEVVKFFDKSLTEQVLNFRMKSGTLDMGLEVVILAGENPANEIMRRIAKNKPNNDFEKVADAYSAQIYTKVELDLVNIKPEMKTMKLFKSLQFIFDNIDSVSDVKPFLPAYLAESMYDAHYVKGIGRKDVLTAQRISGLKNQTIIDFIGSMNEEYNIYDNNMRLLGKEFISPFSNTGLMFYEYYIMDSTKVKGKWSYKLKFKPKDKSGNTFYGDFWVSMDDYALLMVNMRMNPDANINLVNRIIIYQEYDPLDPYWLPVKQKTVIDFATGPKEKGLGIIGRKTTSYKDFIINAEDAKETFVKADPEGVHFDEVAKPDSFWISGRHEQLSINEEGVYEMVDSVQNVPVFKTFVEIVEIIISGYKELGPIKIGPYSNLISWNNVEGVRLSLGVGTSNQLSKKFQIYGYAGYGFQDKRWKYGGDMQYVFNRYRRSAIGASFTNDITFENRNSEERKTQSLFAGWLRRAIPQKMMYVQEGKIWFLYSWKKGFSNRIAILHRRINPAGHDLASMGGLNFKFLQPHPDNGGSFDTLTQIRTTEMVLKFRYAFKEKVLGGPFKDVSLGSKYPIVELSYTLGVKGILDAQYDFHKLRLSIYHWFYISPVGWLEYEVEVGKVFGTLPYLLLETHPGNEAYFYNKKSFNSMNSFEFVSDFFVHARLEHHWDGFILNRIPFIRKWLKWRLVTAVRASWGTLSAKNFDANRLNHYDRSIKHSINRKDWSEGSFYGSFDKGPYTEVSVGIENIFQIIRVDALWRVNYLDNRDAQLFSVRMTLNFTF